MISDELNEYISEVTMNFMEHAHGVRKIVKVENSRQKQIRLEIILLIELYKGIELNKKEKEILNKHLMQYDYKTDLNRCIYQVVYEITDRIMTRVETIKRDNIFKFDGNIYGIYREYLGVLEEYTNSLLHAMCFNHQLVLIKPDKHEVIRPTMDFDSKCFVKTGKTRKRTLNMD